jgi:hypothetical protein
MSTGSRSPPPCSATAACSLPIRQTARSTRPPPAPGRRPARWSTPASQAARPCLPTGRSSTPAARGSTAASKLLLRALRQRRAVHPLAQTPRDRIGARLSHAPYDRLPRPRLDQRPPALGYGGGEAGCTSRRRRPPSLRDLPGPACLLRVLARLDPGTVPHQQKLWLHDIPLSDLAEFSINGPARRNGPWSSPGSVESCCWIPCQAT